MISFYISVDAYQAEEGMTWQEWTTSAYNTADFTTRGNSVRTADGNTVLEASANDVIISGKTYAVLIEN